MNRTERLYRIDQLLSDRKSVPLEDFLSDLEVSRATFKRDIEYMRDRLGAPIVWDRETRGYRFSTPSPGEPAYELPGLWFTAGEIFALLASHKVLSEIGPGILLEHIAPLLNRLSRLMEIQGQTADQVTDRVRLLPMGQRKVEPRHFSLIAKALLERRQLRIVAYSRSRDETLTRLVSPQRLVHYRDNWYLDVWCHLRDALRTFSVETIATAQIEDAPAREVPGEVMQAYFAGAYGIFAGIPTETAILHFAPERARWVAVESWHPRQVGELLSDGSYRLEIPYSDPRELLMDILRHGSHVLVEGPASLRDLVLHEARRLIDRYEK